MRNLISMDLYRYQIIPIQKQYQLNLLSSYQDIIKNKNIYFASALKEGEFKHANSRLLKKLTNLSTDFYSLRLGKIKNIKVFDENFTPEHIPSYPSTLIIIDNNPFNQIMAIEQSSLFSSTFIVAKIILKTLNQCLEAKNLTIKLLPIFEEKSVWDFIEENKSTIQQIEFTLITPNMSNISGRLDEDLKRTAKVIRSTETKVKFQTDKDSTLELDSKNETISGLVNYASQGGGRVTLKGVSAKYDSKNKQRSINIDSLVFDNVDTALVAREFINGKIDKDSDNNIS